MLMNTIFFNALNKKPPEVSFRGLVNRYATGRNQ